MNPDGKNWPPDSDFRSMFQSTIKAYTNRKTSMIALIRSRLQLVSLLGGLWKQRLVARNLAKPKSVWGKTVRIASVCLLLYWAAIFLGTHLPGSSMPKVGNDKILHFGAFAGLAFLISWAFPKHIGSSISRPAWTFALVAGYAMVDELTQMLVPRRTCDLYDFLADACGAAIGICAYVIAKMLLTRFGVGRSLITTLSR